MEDTNERTEQTETSAHSITRIASGKSNSKAFLQLLIVVMLGIFVWYFFVKAPAPGTIDPDEAPGAISGVPEIDPADIGSIVTEPSTGKEFVSNEIIVEFLPSLDERKALDIIESINGEMIARTTARPVFYVRITDDKGDGVRTLGAVERLEKNPSVIHAEPNYITSINTSASPGDGSTSDAAPKTE